MTPADEFHSTHDDQQQGGRQHPREVSLPERPTVRLRRQPNQPFGTDAAQAHRTGHQQQVADELFGSLVATPRVFGHHLADDDRQVLGNLAVLLRNVGGLVSLVLQQLL